MPTVAAPLPRLVFEPCPAGAGASTAVLWAAACAIACLIFAVDALASPPQAGDALRQIEQKVERDPARAARELDDWVARHAALQGLDPLRVALIRTEIAASTESSASALAKVDELLPRLVEAGDPGLHARALAARVRLLDFLNRGAEAIADATTALQQAVAAGDRELQVEVLVRRAALLSNRAEFAGAYAALEQAEQLARAIGSHHAQGNVAYYAGWLASAAGDRSRAVEMFERALAAYRNDRDPGNTADTLVGLGIALIRDRRAADALAPLDEALRLFDELRDARGAAVAQAPRAVALAAARRATDALAASDAALATLRPHASDEEMLFALIYRAQAANLIGNTPVALGAVDEARRYADVTENEVAHLTYLREAAAAFAAAARYQDAHAALADLVRRSEAQNEQRLSRRLAAQRGQIESQRLEHDNDLLRREAEASRQAMAALERAAQLRTLLVALAAGLVGVMLAGLAWQRRVNRRIAHLAATDALTGTFNRRQIDAAGQAAFSAHRAGNRPFSVALLDLDHFKQVNDRHGHAVGDDVLRAVAQALAGGLRRADLLGRYGGEEFAVVLPDSSPAEAAAIVERLRVAVAALGRDRLGIDDTLTLSAGVATARAGDTRFEAVVKRADVALYRAKAAGRDRVVVDAVEPLSPDAIAV